MWAEVWKFVRSEVGGNLQIFILWVISAVIDAAFLCIWSFIQYWSNKIIASLELSGIDVWVFGGFQILFALSTLIPVVIYIYTDAHKMWLRTRREIKQEQIKNSRRRNLKERKPDDTTGNK